MHFNQDPPPPLLGTVDMVFEEGFFDAEEERE